MEAGGISWRKIPSSTLSPGRAAKLQNIPFPASHVLYKRVSFCALSARLIRTNNHKICVRKFMHVPSGFKVRTPLYCDKYKEKLDWKGSDRIQIGRLSGQFFAKDFLHFLLYEAQSFIEQVALFSKDIAANAHIMALFRFCPSINFFEQQFSNPFFSVCRIDHQSSNLNEGFRFKTECIKPVCPAKHFFGIECHKYAMIIPFHKGLNALMKLVCCGGIAQLT